MAFATEKETKLTVLRGGKPGKKEFQALPLIDKLHALAKFSSAEKMDLIIDDPKGRNIVHLLDPQDLYVIIKDVGANDAVPLISFASPDQLLFFADIDTWESWTVSQEKALEWLSLLLDAGEDQVCHFLHHADLEFVVLMFMREINVGGGIGDLLHDDERLSEWDQTFDQLFMIKYKHPERAPFVGRLLDIIFRTDHPLYLVVMEAVKNEMECEIEELAYKFRCDRLADLGFPSIDEAMTVYVEIDPDSFIISTNKALLPVEDDKPVLIPVAGDSFLQRVMAKGATDDVALELRHLMNNVLVADNIALADHQAIDDAVKRVYGYLNIGLEFIAHGNEDEGVRILHQEYLKRLFKLGYSIISRVSRRAKKVSKTNVTFATGRALIGFSAKRPKFYRGLDADAVDGFREFRDNSDITKAIEFLDRIEGTEK